MSYPLYSVPKVPSRAHEHMALLFLGLILILSAFLGYEIVRMKAFEYVVGTASMQGMLAVLSVGAWAFFRFRRLRAEKRKADFYEALRNGC